MFGLLVTVSTNSIPFLRAYDVVKYLAVGSECFSKAELALMNVPNEARKAYPNSTFHHVLLYPIQPLHPGAAK